MKKSIAIAAVCIGISGICFAQTNTPTKPVTLYPESIQIKSDDGKLMADIDANGKVAVSPAYSYDSVVNILIIRMVNQNKQYNDQLDRANKILEEVKAKANATTMKAQEIYQVWNPPAPQPIPTVKAPIPISTNSTTIKSTPDTLKEESKKSSFWSRFW